MTNLRRRIVRAAAAALLSAVGTTAQAGETRHILAASWQPAFCETRPAKPECETQTARRFDAEHFALHGLWPVGANYCGVNRATQRLDRAGDWVLLPEVELSQTTRQELERVMPGTMSLLERHEWVKHGTCYDGDVERYYADALALMAALNDSTVRELFAGRIGETISREEIRASFDLAFGAGAGDRVRVRCAEDGGRRIVTEITIGLGPINEGAPLGERILAASPISGGCGGGFVDAVGLQ